MVNTLVNLRARHCLLMLIVLATRIIDKHHQFNYRSQVKWYYKIYTMLWYARVLLYGPLRSIANHHP